MKARALKKILNDTTYRIANNTDHISIGSYFCSDLITVNKTDYKIKYALDHDHRGRAALGNKELVFIWDRLEDIIANGEIKDIIEGKDIIDNPLPVYTIRDGNLIETFTDEYGWPNTDEYGFCMYDNTYFATKKEALNYGIKNAQAMIEIYAERYDEAEKKRDEYADKQAEAIKEKGTFVLLLQKEV